MKLYAESDEKPKMSDSSGPTEAVNLDVARTRWYGQSPDADNVSDKGVSAFSDEEIICGLKESRFIAVVHVIVIVIVTSLGLITLLSTAASHAASARRDVGVVNGSSGTTGTARYNVSTVIAAMMRPGTLIFRDRRHLLSLRRARCAASIYIFRIVLSIRRRTGVGIRVGCLIVVRVKNLWALVRLSRLLGEMYRRAGVERLRVLKVRTHRWVTGLAGRIGRWCGVSGKRFGVWRETKGFGRRLRGMLCCVRASTLRIPAKW